MIELRLNNNFVAFIDNEDHYKVVHLPWKSYNVGRGRFHCGIKVKLENKKYKSIWLHHVIAGYPPFGKRVYFKDKNPLNCQKENIVFLTHSEHTHVTHPLREDFIGVTVEYLARIKINNKLKVIGTFKTEIEAAKAYNEKAKSLYGDKAKLNILED
jgi:hypothetical protein